MFLNQFKFIIIMSVVLLLVAISCITTKNNLRQSALSDRALKQIEALTQFEQQFLVMPGQATLLSFPYFGPFKSEALICNGNKIPFFVSVRDNKAITYVARSYFDDAQDFACNFTFSDGANGDEKEIINPIKAIAVRDFAYPQEHLKVARNKVVLSKKDNDKAAEERKMLDMLFQKSSETLLFDGSFKSPLNSKITSIFGTKRTLNGIKQTEHLGTDFRAPIGTKITAANKGRVVFVGDLFFGGNTVVVDHGLGIFTT